MEDFRESETIWNAAFINIFIIYCTMNMSQQMMMTLIPLYAKFLGASATLVGFVSSMFAITALAIRPVASPAFDSFSKKKLLIAAMAIITTAFGFYSVSDSIAFVIAARLLHGIGMGLLGPLCLALASDALSDKKLGSGIAIFSLGQAIAQAVGPDVGLRLSGSIGYNNTFMIATAIMGLSCVLGFTIKEKPRVREKYVISWDRIVAKEAIRPSVMMFLLVAPYACINSFLAILGGELRGIANIGLFFTIYAVTLIATRPFIGKAADKYGFDKVIIPGILSFALSFVLIYFAKSLEWFLVASVFAALGYGTCNPSIQALCMKSVPKERRGAGGSTNYIGMDLGMLTGPVLAGFIVDQAKEAAMSEENAYALTFLAMAIPMLIALVFFIANKKRLLADSMKYQDANGGQEQGEA